VKTHLLAALAVMLWAAASAGAQTALFLSVTGTGNGLELGVLAGPIGAGGAPVAAAWPGGRAEWVFVRTVGAQENLARVSAEAGARTVTVPRPAGAGPLVAGVDLAPVLVELKGDELAALAQAAGFPGPERERLARVAAERGGVRLRRVESVKAIVPGSDPVGGSVVTSKAGQVAELRPLASVLWAPAGSDVPLKVFVDGSAAAGVRVIAVNETTGARHELTSDAGGVCLVPMAPGAWRAEFHHVRAPAADEPADGVMYTGTLTFRNTGRAS